MKLILVAKLFHRVLNLGLSGWSTQKPDWLVSWRSLCRPLNYRVLILLGVSAALHGCISNPLSWHPETHIVQRGQTLAVIALRYEVPVKDIVAWNRLDNPDRIFPGQKLRVSAPPGWRRTVATRAPTRTTNSLPSVTASPIKWFWPAQGVLVPNRNNAGVGDGINIAQRIGSPVFAAASGKVVYSGSGLSGYGNLIIVKHTERFLSAYGYNQRLLVAEGQQVTGGQRIADMGVGPGQKPMLHFEIRRDGKPVDPLTYLKKKQ